MRRYAKRLQRRPRFGLDHLRHLLAVLEEIVLAPLAERQDHDQKTATLVAAAREQLTRQGSTQTSSMYRDLQQGKSIEAEQIVGDLVRRAREARVATPLLCAAFASLSIYQSRSAAR
ncbi:ketopantoate reductase family protein [Xanthobacter sediminis]